MNSTKILVGEAYAWILLESVVITIHLWLTGAMMGSVRRRFFNKDFYEKKFPQYRSLTDVLNVDSGYPDDGQGRLADQLDDRDWFVFNNYRRAHYNYLEVKFFSFVSFRNRTIVFHFRDLCQSSFHCSLRVFPTRVSHLFLA